MRRPTRAAPTPPAPVTPYRWALTDYRLSSNSCGGQADTPEQAKADALRALGMIGRGMNGIGITISRPSGRGGWFAKATPDRPGHYDWEPWEKET